MAKWIKFHKSPFGISAEMVLFDKVCFYVGKTDHWGIGFDINFYDRSLTFEILNLYTGVELWHGPIQDFVPRSKGDMLD
jgi:hypothetical protein